MVPALLTGALLLASPAAQAHPFGAEFFGHQVKIEVGTESIRVDYLAEIPTQVLLRELAGVEEMSPEEGEGFSEQKAEELAAGLRLDIDGEKQTLTRLPIEVETGRGSSRFFTFQLAFTADIPAGEHHQLRLVNSNYPDERTYFSNEIVVAESIEVESCSLFALGEGGVGLDRSGQWRMEEENREVRLDFGVHEGGVHGLFRTIAGTPGGFRSASEAVASDPLLSMLSGDMSPGMFLLAILAALFFGAAHALAPGHGKTLVAGYLVGNRGTIRQAILLGIVVTFAHTISVILLGIATLTLQERFAPEIVYPWIEFSSGLLVLGVGAALLRQRAQALAASRAHAAHGHSHDHSHGHGHSHDVSQASLLSLGISGGIVPCPTALVVLLTAISMHRVGLGLVLVTAFSLGLGIVLVAIAIAVVLLGQRLKGKLEPTGFVAHLPLASAVLVTVIGIGITWRAVQGVLG